MALGRSFVRGVANVRTSAAPRIQSKPKTLVPTSKTTLGRQIATAVKSLHDAPKGNAPPEVGRSPAPAPVSRAIANAKTAVRLPDRGAANVKAGLVLTMPDGTRGARLRGHAPLLSSLRPQIEATLKQGGNPQIRQTIAASLRKSSYQTRVEARPVVAHRGIAPYGLSIAKARRRKPGTPTGFQGDRAPMAERTVTSFLAASAVAPASAVEGAAASRRGGTGAARLPIPAPVASAPPSPMSTEAALNKSYYVASASGEANPAPAKTTGFERTLLLVAVGAAAFFLIRG